MEMTRNYPSLELLLTNHARHVYGISCNCVLCIHQVPAFCISRCEVFCDKRRTNSRNL